MWNIVKHSSFDATISALYAETSALGSATSAITRKSFDATISALDAETSALDAETSAIARSYRRYRRRIFGNIGVGVIPHMCNRVTNHGDRVMFPDLRICPLYGAAKKFMKYILFFTIEFINVLIYVPYTIKNYLTPWLIWWVLHSQLITGYSGHAPQNLLWQKPWWHWEVLPMSTSLLQCSSFATRWMSPTMFKNNFTLN